MTLPADKEREAGDGHDGTWVAHPDLVPVALEVFDRLMPQPNQVTRRRDDAITRDMLLEVHKGVRTEAGLRENIRVGVQYIENLADPNSFVRAVHPTKVGLSKSSDISAALGAASLVLHSRLTPHQTSSRLALAAR